MLCALMCAAVALLSGCSSVAVAQPKPTSPQVAVFIGDSYTSGVGGNGTRWTSLVAAKLGWTEVNLGRGGTGYKATAGMAGCGKQFCPNYDGMVAAAAAAKPDIVVVSGGRNDAGVYPTEISAVFTDLRKALPNAKIYAVSPLIDDNAAPAWFTQESMVVKAAVEAAGGTFLDIGQPLTGHPELVSSDSVHPNAAGYQAIAAAMLAALG